MSRSCEICGRTGPEEFFERHHLFPGKQRRTKVSREEDIIWVDRDCGDQIHEMFDNRELRNNLDSLAALRIAMEPFIRWVRSRPIDQKVTMKRKKRKL